MASEPSAAPALRKLTRSEWGIILVLAAINFTHMVDFVIIMPLGARLISEFQITNSEFGRVVSVYGYAAGIASLLASFVIDRFDRKYFLAVMYTGFTLSTLFCGLAMSYETLLLSRGLAGVFGGLAAAAMMAIIGDTFPPHLRGRATGAVMSAFAVASIAGLPIGLQLAEWLGRGAPFVWLAGLCAMVLAATHYWLPSMTGHIGELNRRPLKEFAAVVREPNHLWAFVFTFSLVLGTFSVASFIGPYLIAVNGWSEGHLAIIYLVAGFCTLIGMNVIGILSDRYGKRRVFLVLASLAIVVSIGITNLPPVHLAVGTLALSLFMVCAAGRMVPAQAMLIGVAAPQIRGAFMSLNTAVQQFATGLAPEIAGNIMDLGDPKTMNMYWLVGIVAATSAVISLVLSGYIRPAKTDGVKSSVAESAVSVKANREPAAVGA